MLISAVGIRIPAGALLAGGLIVIALNPGVPSLPYALLWLGVMAISRGVSLLAPWLAVAIDVSVVVVLVLGMEIGGLILMPSLLAFTVADAVSGERDPVRVGGRQGR